MHVMRVGLHAPLIGIVKEPEEVLYLPIPLSQKRFQMKGHNILTFDRR